MQGSFNTHLIAISCIVFVVAVAFLIFDLDDKFYPVSTSQYAANIDYVEAPNQTLINEPIAESKNQIGVEKQIVSKTAPQKQILQKIQPAKSRLNELENKQFLLDLSGNAYPELSGMTKKANLILTLKPIKGTNLQEFDVMESRMIIDNAGIPVSGIGAKLDGKNLVLNFVADNVGEFSIRATIDDKILDDTNNKLNVIVEDQDFYLVKKETPYRLNLVGTMKY